MIFLQKQNTKINMCLRLFQLKLNYIYIAAGGHSDFSSIAANEDLVLVLFSGQCQLLLFHFLIFSLRWGTESSFPSFEVHYFPSSPSVDSTRSVCKNPFGLCKKVFPQREISLNTVTLYQRNSGYCKSTTTILWNTLYYCFKCCRYLKLSSFELLYKLLRSSVYSNASYSVK